LVKFDGTDGTRDLRIREAAQKGLNFRFGSRDIDEALLMQGTFVRPKVTNSQDLRN